MRAVTNINALSLQQAVDEAAQALTAGRRIAFSGGGSDLLQQIKEGAVNPDILINLRTVSGADQISAVGNGLQIGGMTRLSSLATDPQLLTRYAVLAQAAAQVGSPQIRNVGTLGGNVSQRPWCWYYRNGFPCYKAGGDQCYSVTGENQLHAIFGGGPSFIAHPSDIAPALVALDAQIDLLSPDGSRRMSAADFFILPSVNPARENVLAEDELVAAIHLPEIPVNTRSAFHKVMDRETWTHAVVSAAVVLQIDVDGICRAARIVLGGVAPVPWRVQAAEQLLTGQRVTAALAASAGDAAIAGAQPLAKNAYKVPLTAAVVERTIMQLVN